MSDNVIRKYIYLPSGPPYPMRPNLQVGIFPYTLSDMGSLIVLLLNIVDGFIFQYIT